MSIRREDKLRFFLNLINIVIPLINVIIIILLVYTPMAAIVGTITANMVVVFIQYIFLKRGQDIKLDLFSVVKIKYLLLAIIFVPITVLLRAIIMPNNIFIVMALVVNIAIYIAILMISMDEFFLYLFRIIINFENKKR